MCCFFFNHYCPACVDTYVESEIGIKYNNYNNKTSCPFIWIIKTGRTASQNLSEWGESQLGAQLVGFRHGHIVLPAAAPLLPIPALLSPAAPLLSAHPASIPAAAAPVVPPSIVTPVISPPLVASVIPPSLVASVGTPWVSFPASLSFDGNLSSWSLLPASRPAENSMMYPIPKKIRAKYDVLGPTITNLWYE